MNTTRLGLMDTSEAAGRATLSVDQVEYLADMIAELRGLADDAGLSTLAALALAQVEAAQQFAARRKG